MSQQPDAPAGGATAAQPLVVPIAHLLIEVLRRPVASAQYTSYDFGKTLRTSRLLASMGRVGSAYDNAMAESFFATLKAELVYQRTWPTRHEPEMEVFSYIEGFYNPRSRHSRVGNISPDDYEKNRIQEMTQHEASA